MSRFNQRASKRIHSTTHRPVEALEDRRMFTVTPAFIAPNTLTFIGDGANDQVNLYDNGVGGISGSFTNAGGGLTAFGVIPGIQNIRIATGAGNDYVTYQVVGDMWAGGARFVSQDLGTGDDVSRFYAGNDIDLGPNAYFDMKVYAGAGKDYIGAFYSGELDGVMRLTQGGGDGNDRLYTEARLDVGSSGRFLAREYGDNGDDTMDLLVRKVNPFDLVGVDAGASGGNHLFGDRLTRTPLAWNDATVEFLAVVP